MSKKDDSAKLLFGGGKREKERERKEGRKVLICDHIYYIMS
jgi:hypothetical protein